MKRGERNALMKWAETLTDEELEKEYYDAVYDSLGSETEEMYERGYDIVDIEEREKYEKYLGEKSRLLEKLCTDRGIELWKRDKWEYLKKHPEFDRLQQCFSEKMLDMFENNIKRYYANGEKQENVTVIVAWYLHQVPFTHLAIYEPNVKRGE